MNEFHRLGRYQIETLLGSGAYADVYRAQDTMLKRTVALKLLKPALLADEDAFARFVQEAQVSAGLFHPHIATTLDMGEADGRYFIAMRYVDGLSLDKLLKQRGSLPWAEALRIIEQVSSALDFAHRKGLVHRDVKPGNIIISPEEGAVLTDFGLVRALESSGLSTRTGAIIGTPQYIPPEIWQGQPATPAVDVYALACVLVEMLTGKVLFDGPTPWAIMQKHAETPEIPSDFSSGAPSDIAIILEQALVKNPQDRLTANELVHLLSSPSSAPDWVKQPALNYLSPSAQLESASSMPTDIESLKGVYFEPESQVSYKSLQDNRQATVNNRQVRRKGLLSGLYSGLCFLLISPPLYFVFAENSSLSDLTNQDFGVWGFVYIIFALLILPQNLISGWLGERRVLKGSSDEPAGNLLFYGLMVGTVISLLCLIGFVLIGGPVSGKTFAFYPFMAFPSAFSWLISARIAERQIHQ